MDAGRHATSSRFRAPYDALVLTLTIVFSAILIAVAAAAAVALAGQASGAVFASLGVAGCGALLVGSYAFAPNAYRVEPGALVIERPIGPMVIPLDGLQEVTVGRPNWRVGFLGYRNGGLFGSMGGSTNPDWGGRVSRVAA